MRKEREWSTFYTAFNVKLLLSGTVVGGFHISYEWFELWSLYCHPIVMATDCCREKLNSWQSLIQKNHYKNSCYIGMLLHFGFWTTYHGPKSVY